MRDECGRWLAGFFEHIGSTSAFVAEMWGLRDSLILYSNLNIQCLIVEVDARALMDALLNFEYVNIVVSPLLDDCRKFIESFPSGADQTLLPASESLC